MNLLPMPKKLEIKKGEFYLYPNLKINIDEKGDISIYQYAKILKEDIRENLGFDSSISRADKNKADIFLTLDKNLKENTYIININKDRVILSAYDKISLLYAVQTFRQLLINNSAVLPCLFIEDYPSVENRGYYLDVTRGRIPKLEELKKLADTLSFYKLNQLQLYIEHSFLFEGLSEMYRDDTPLVAEEILELDEYCYNLGIELVPSLSTFGHFYKLLRTKTFRHLCELDEVDEEFGFMPRHLHHTLDVSNEESFTLVSRLIKEYIVLFRSKKFNICADETFDLGKGKSKNLADKIGVGELYFNFVNRICDLVISLGSIPMFWSDIIVKYPELLNKLPEESICLTWGYEANQDDKAAKILYDYGVKQYLCPGTNAWNEWIPSYEIAYKNIKIMGEYRKKYSALGLLNTDWGDYGHINQTDFSIPALIYGACASWNEDLPDFKEINKHISLIEYRDKSEKIIDILNEINKSQAFSWTFAIKYQEVIKGILKYKEPLRILEEDTKLADAKSLLDKLDFNLKELIKVSNSIDIKYRNKINDFYIASGAIKLFTKIGLIILNKKYNKNINIDFKASELALELENWYLLYKNLFRSISKESELYRIGNAIFWYADYLRSLD